MENDKQPTTAETMRQRAIEAYKSNCVFFNNQQCNFTGTPCNTTYCTHLRSFIEKLNKN